MLILDKPFVSRYLLQTAAELELGVLDTPFAHAAALPVGARLLEDAEAIAEEKDRSIPKVFCSSENSLDWVRQHLDFTDLPQKVALFKDKVRFRELLQPVYPDFSFQEVTLEELGYLNVDSLPMPFVIKPAVGFFSMGVFVVQDPSDWPGTVHAIQQEMKRIHGLYPTTVMDDSRFIVEQLVTGTEYAIDAYFADDGEPVILNVLEHTFASTADVSDRFYCTSAAIVQRHYVPFMALLAEIGQRAELKSFPVHLEVRVDEEGRVVPIELNPLRFAGWCTTDIAHYAHGINPYAAFFHQTPPHWPAIFTKEGTESYGLVVADIPKGIDRTRVRGIEQEKFLAQFDEALEVRWIDWKQYPVFAFLFIRMQQPDQEAAKILEMDFSTFLKMN